jgi:hypothetical protein
VSSYFDALLRSAGRAPPLHAPQPEAAAAGSDIVELDVERVATPDPAARAPPPAPVAPGATPTRDARAFSTIAHASPSPAVASVPPAASSQPADVLRAAPPAPEPDARTATAAPPHTSEPDAHAHAVVRAALNWVAADPRRPAPTNPLAPPSDPTPPEPPPASRAQPPVIDTAHVAPMRAAPPAEAAPVAASAVVPRAGRTEARDPALPAAQAAAPQEDRVEVTIGEIHIVVDAPVERAAARAAPPVHAPALALPAPEPAAPGSGLARRALRRI